MDVSGEGSIMSIYNNINRVVCCIKYTESRRD